MSPREEHRRRPAGEEGGDRPRRPRASGYPETAGSLLARRINAEDEEPAWRFADPSGEPPSGEI
jgi:hypothetical protein